MLAMGDALTNSGEPRLAIDTIYQQAFELATGKGDANRASRACNNVFMALLRQGAGPAIATPEALEWAERAKRYSQPDTPEDALADAVQGSATCAHLKKWKEGVDLLNQALDKAYRLGDVQVFCNVATLWMFYVWVPKYADKQRKLAKDVTLLPRDEVKKNYIYEALGMAEIVFYALGDIQKKKEIELEYIEFFRETGYKSGIYGIPARHAQTACREGRLEECLELCYKILTLGHEIGLVETAQATYHSIVYRPLIYLGRLPELAPLTPEVLNRPMALPTQTLLLVHKGHIDQAREYLEKAVLSRPYIGTDQDYSWIWLDVFLLEAAVLLEHDRAAELLMTRFNETSIRTTGGWETTITARHLGSASALLGRLEQARFYYNQAMEVCRSMNFRPELALTRFQLAELLLEHYPQEQEEAQGHLDFAIGEFEQMKMKPSLEKALEMKEKTGS
jgi:tetratricopeptide (TPR) repeat protein